MEIKLEFGEFYFSRDKPKLGYVVVRAKTEAELAELVKQVSRQMMPGFEMNIEGPPLFCGPFQLRVNRRQWPFFYCFLNRIASRQLTRMESVDFVATLELMPATPQGATCKQIFEGWTAPAFVPGPACTESKKKQDVSTLKSNPQQSFLLESDFPVATARTDRIATSLIQLLPSLSSPSFRIYESDGYQIPPSRNSLIVRLALLLKEEDFLISEQACQACSAKIGSLKQIAERINKTSREDIISFHLTRLFFSQFLHMNSELTMTERIEWLFLDRNLLPLLGRLRDARPDLQNTISSTDTLSKDSNSELLDIWDGEMRGMVFMGREDGRFRSLCNTDEYGEESNSYDHDNEWYDR